MQRKPFMTALLGLGMLFSGLSAQAQGKPLEWVVGYPAGGGSDVVARTLADLRGQEKIEADSIAEAVNYRSLDRNLWQ